MKSLILPQQQHRHSRHIQDKMEEQINKPIDKPKGNKLVIILGILLGLCIISIIGYFAYNYYNDSIIKAGQEGYQEAYTLGATDAITYITTQAETCKQVPINISGKVTTLISLSCLQQSQ